MKDQVGNWIFWGIGARRKWLVQRQRRLLQTNIGGRCAPFSKGSIKRRITRRLLLATWPRYEDKKRGGFSFNKGRAVTKESLRRFYHYLKKKQGFFFLEGENGIGRGLSIRSPALGFHHVKKRTWGGWWLGWFLRKGTFSRTPEGRQKGASIKSEGKRLSSAASSLSREGHGQEERGKILLLHKVGGT